MRKIAVNNAELLKRLRVMANPYRFRILELTQSDQMNIRALSSAMNLSYTKCADYVAMLSEQGLVRKTKTGKEVFVRSKVRISGDKVQF